MTAIHWRDAVVAYIRQEAQPEDKYGHQPRLYALAEEIAASCSGECDDDVLFAAAWMHDLGVFLRHRPSDPVALSNWNHVPYTIERSRQLLKAWGFPEEKLEQVSEAIRTHQAKDTASTMEAVILRDADILEQLGAIGTLRAVVKVGRDTRYATYTDVIPTLERAVETLPSELKLERSQQMGLSRVSTLKSFLSAVREEAGERLY